MADVSVQNERINGWIPSSATNVILNWPERIKTQPHDDRDNCFLPFDSKGPCGMTVNNDIDDDSARKHGDSHRFLRSCCSRYLSLNLSLSVSAKPTAWPPHALAGTKPVLDNFLTPVILWLSGRSYFPDKRESHLALLSSRPFFRFQLLGSRSQVYSKRFDTRRHNHSFFLAAFLITLRVRLNCRLC